MLNYQMKRIDGSEENLTDYRGKVLLLVNVASQCGLTPQYAGLQSLYEQYQDKGFEIVGFPANEFGAQEPGSDSKIARFCATGFGITFPLFSKIVVKGEGIHPLYEELTTMPEPIGGEVQWNFQKYLVDRGGEVLARFSPRTTPEDPALVSAIEDALGTRTG